VPSRLETDVFVHPHQSARQVLDGLAERAGWIDLARASERLELIEWDLQDYDMCVGTLR
jgi:hypothetical protein